MEYDDEEEEVEDEAEEEDEEEESEEDERESITQCIHRMPFKGMKVNLDLF